MNEPIRRSAVLEANHSVVGNVFKYVLLSRCCQLVSAQIDGPSSPPKLLPLRLLLHQAPPIMLQHSSTPPPVSGLHGGGGGISASLPLAIVLAKKTLHYLNMQV